MDDIYRPLQAAAEHFNAALFEGTLPAHVFTLQRSKGSPGFFSPNRWQHAEGGQELGEIALNPKVLSNKPLWSLFRTIVREQCHLWQHTYGSPARPGYHNTEWADKIESLGLMPTRTGASGSARTGQKISAVPDPSGRFVQACAELIRAGFYFPWTDKEAADPADNDLLSVPNIEVYILERLNTPLNAQIFRPFRHSTTDAKKKITYHCPECATKVWGKPGLKLRCGTCGDEYIHEHF